MGMRRMLDQDLMDDFSKKRTKEMREMKKESMMMDVFDHLDAMMNSPYCFGSNIEPYDYFLPKF